MIGNLSSNAFKINGHLNDPLIKDLKLNEYTLKNVSKQVLQDELLVFIKTAVK